MRSVAAALAVAGLGVGMLGCGSATPSGGASVPPAAEVRALAGSPPPLAALHARSSGLLAGGAAAFRAELRGLRGYPVVINKWASWCGPCQAEFPAFASVAARLGRRVAFVGLNGRQDSVGDARAFLRSHPVPYPSFLDEDEAIARTLQASGYDPVTVFLDRAGRGVYVHVGAYPDADALARDVRRYARP